MFCIGYLLVRSSMASQGPSALTLPGYKTVEGLSYIVETSKWEIRDFEEKLGDLTRANSINSQRWSPETRTLYDKYKAALVSEYSLFDRACAQYHRSWDEFAASTHATQMPTRDCNESIGRYHPANQ